MSKDMDNEKAILEHFKVGRWYRDIDNGSDGMYQVINIDLEEKTMHVEYEDGFKVEYSIHAFFPDLQPEVKYIDTPLWRKLEGLE